jgi:hypothetical protein
MDRLTCENLLETKGGHRECPITACLAHAEVTYFIITQQILHIFSFFKHNSACGEAVLAHFPHIPLHPSIYQIALGQLQNGVALTEIQEKNHTLLQSPPFMGKFSESEKESHRWLLRPTDTQSLYRQFNCMQGVKVTGHTHMNIHEWMDPDSHQYNQTLANAIFYYSTRGSRDDRFEACVATKEMNDAL